MKLKDSIIAGAEHMSDKGYEISTLEKQAEFAAKRNDQFTINKYLFAMLGSTELVEKWWTGPNKHWQGETPLAVYDRGGQDEILDYVISCSQGGW
jgi:hypothetical protein